jgi:hypothetical protein
MRDADVADRSSALSKEQQTACMHVTCASMAVAQLEDNIQAGRLLPLETIPMYHAPHSTCAYVHHPQQQSACVRMTGNHRQPSTCFD